MTLVNKEALPSKSYPDFLAAFRLVWPTHGSGLSSHNKEIPNAGRYILLAGP